MGKILITMLFIDLPAKIIYVLRELRKDVKKLWHNIAVLFADMFTTKTKAQVSCTRQEPNLKPFRTPGNALSAWLEKPVSKRCNP